VAHQIVADELSLVNDMRERSDNADCGAVDKSVDRRATQPTDLTSEALLIATPNAS
jgi:hypothetical protein